MPANDMNHMAHLDYIALGDVSVLRSKEATYQGSWKKAGGRSAWFMARRNMDRLINMLAPPKIPHAWSIADYEDVVQSAENSETHDCTVDSSIAKYLLDSYVAEDIFRAIEAKPSGEDGTVLACVRDLRRYFMLIEAEMVAQGVVSVEGARELMVKKGGYTVDPAPKTYLRLDPVVRASVTDPVPGTPEDGGHHASLRPWCLTKAQYDHEISNASTVRGTALSLFYKKRAVDLYHLEDSVENFHIPEFLAPYYDLMNDKKTWVLKLRHVPDEVREYYAMLRHEQNTKEHELLPEWQQMLYDWDSAACKFIIADIHKAWTE